MVILTVAIVYFVLVGAMAALQEKLIFPGASWQGTMEAQFAPPADAQLAKVSAATGESVALLFGSALTPDGRSHPSPTRQPTILFFYGNGMCLADMTPEFESMRRLGANVCAPEYVGYGLSDGSPSEQGCYATADAAYEWLIARDDIDPARIVAGGWSLGAGVAVDLAARRPIAGLIMHSPFTSLTATAKRQFPFLPVGLLLRHRFPSDEKIMRVKCPVLLGHGDQDTLVPAEMSATLASLAPNLLERFVVAGAGHNDFLSFGQRQQSQATLRLFDLIDQSSRDSIDGHSQRSIDDVTVGSKP